MHASLADILADLVQNSVEAGAGFIEVVLEESPERICFEINDNGKGMDQATLEKASDPFWTDGIKHPGRKVGLGIPFLLQTAQQCGGRADIQSAPGKGTTVKADFPARHLDLPPLGDLILLWVQCLSMDGAYQMNIRRVRRTSDGTESSYVVDRAELSDVLGGLDDAGALGLLRDYLTSLEAALE